VDGVPSVANGCDVREPLPRDSDARQLLAAVRVALAALGSGDVAAAVEALGQATVGGERLAEIVAADAMRLAAGAA
jgi:hypothetical protein